MCSKSSLSCDCSRHKVYTYECSKGRQLDKNQPKWHQTITGASGTSTDSSWKQNGLLPKFYHFMTQNCCLLSLIGECYGFGQIPNPQNGFCSFPQHFHCNLEDQPFFQPLALQNIFLKEKNI